MKTTAIILMVLAGLMFGAFLGAVGGIYLQSRIDKAVKEAEIGEKDKEIKVLNDKLAEASRGLDSLVKVINAKSAEIDQKDKTILELQKQAVDKPFTSNISSEEFNAVIRKQFAQGDFSAVQRALESLPPIFLRDFIKQNIGLLDDDLPEDDAKLGEFGGNLFRLIQGEQPKYNPGQTIEDVSFALRVNADNSPISATATFKSTDRRIYACFPNQGSLKGLSKVITRWTCKTTKEIIGFGPKPLNTASPYNFIWWEKREGWPAGEYTVELLSTKEFALIGQGTFTVVAGEEEESKTDESKKDDLPDMEFILTGTIIESKFKLAFIVNTLNHEENIYKEGYILDSKKHGRWTIFSIKKDKVIIRQYNKDGSVAKERILRVDPVKPKSKLQDDIAKFIKEKIGAAVKITVGTKLYSPDRRFLFECSVSDEDGVFKLWITDTSPPSGAKKSLLFEYQRGASALWSPDSKKIIINVATGAGFIDFYMFKLDTDANFIEDKYLEQLVRDKITNPILNDYDMYHLYTTGSGWVDANVLIINAYYPDKVDLKYKVNLETNEITVIK